MCVTCKNHILNCAQAVGDRNHMKSTVAECFTGTIIGFMRRDGIAGLYPVNQRLLCVVEANRRR